MGELPKGEDLRKGFLITARFESSRLPGKVVADINGRTALDLVIDRANFGSLKPLYLCTGETTLNDEVAAIGESREIPVFRGSTSNKLYRWFGCAQKYELDIITVLEADDVFFDWSQTLNAQQRLLKDTSLDAVLPHQRSSNGSGEIGMTIRVKTLGQLVTQFYSDRKQNVDLVDWPIEIQRLKGKFTFSDSPFQSVPQTRMTLDYEEDLEILRWLDLEKGYLASRSDLENFCLDHPAFLSKMNWLNERFTKNKESKV